MIRKKIYILKINDDKFFLKYENFRCTCNYYNVLRWWNTIIKHKNLFEKSFQKGFEIIIVDVRTNKNFDVFKCDVRVHENIEFFEFANENDFDSNFIDFDKILDIVIKIVVHNDTQNDTEKFVVFVVVDEFLTIFSKTISFEHFRNFSFSFEKFIEIIDFWYDSQCRKNDCWNIDERNVDKHHCWMTLKTNENFENLRIRIVKSNKTHEFDVLNIFDFDNESFDDSIELKKENWYS